MRLVALACSLIATAVAEAGDPVILDKMPFEAEVVIAKAKACDIIQRAVGRPVSECFDIEVKASRVVADKIIADATKKDPKPLPPQVKRSENLFLNNGRTMVDPDDRVWNLNGFNQWVLSPCRYVDGQVVCPNKR